MTPVFLGRFAAPGVLLVGVGVFLLVSAGYPPDTRAMPMLVGGVLAVLLVLDLVSRGRGRVGRAVLRVLNPGVASVPGGALWPVLYIAGFGVGLGLFGTLVAVPVYVAGAVRVHGGHSWLAAAVAAGGTALFVWGLFSVLLRLPVFPGLLFGGDF